MSSQHQCHSLKFDRFEKLNEVHVNVFRFKKRTWYPWSSQNMTVISLWIYYYYQEVVLSTTFWLPIWNISLTLSEISRSGQEMKYAETGSMFAVDLKNHKVKCGELGRKNSFTRRKEEASPVQKYKSHLICASGYLFWDWSPSRAFPYMFSRTKCHWTDEVGKTCSVRICIFICWARKW